MENERAVIELYLAEHGLEGTLNEIVNDIVKNRPEDPYIELGQRMSNTSASAQCITEVRARELWSSGQEPCLEVEVETWRGLFRACTGYQRENNEEVVPIVETRLRDLVLNMDITNQEAIDSALRTAEKIPKCAILALSMACCKAGATHLGLPLHEHIAALAGMGSQPTIPMPIICMVCAGDYAKEPTLIPFQEISVIPEKANSLNSALDMLRLIHTKLHALANGSNIGKIGAYELKNHDVNQAFALVSEAVTEAGLHDQVRFAFDAGAAAFARKSVDNSTIEANQEENDQSGALDSPPSNCVLYDMAKFLPKTEEIQDKKEEGPLLAEAKLTKKNGKAAGAKKSNAKDTKAKASTAAAQSQPKVLEVDPNKKGSAEMVQTYIDLCSKYPIATLEDPFWNEDFIGLVLLKEKLDLEALKAAGQVQAEEAVAACELQLSIVGGDQACRLQVAGDQSCHCASDLDKYDEQKTLNTLTLTLSKGQTVTGCIELAKKARSLGWGIQVSTNTEQPETHDTFAASLAVGLCAGQLKLGGLFGMENVAKLNELLRIAHPSTSSTRADAGDSQDGPQWIGSSFRVNAQ